MKDKVYILFLLIAIICFIYDRILKIRLKKYKETFGECIGIKDGPNDEVITKQTYGGKFEYWVDNKKYIHTDMGWYYKKDVLQLGGKYKIYYKKENPNISYSEGELKTAIYLITSICLTIISIFGMILELL